MPVFMDVVMTGLARTVDRFGDAVLLRRTWGDGIHLAFASVDTAADCAVSLQQTMAAFDLGAMGLDPLRGMRIGAHVGPVYEERDPFTNELSYMGANVTRAGARRAGYARRRGVRHPPIRGGGRARGSGALVVPVRRDRAGGEESRAPSDVPPPASRRPDVRLTAGNGLASSTCASSSPAARSTTPVGWPLTSRSPPGC